MQYALIGTRGVPARYGGFETCVEEVGRRLVAAGHTVRVFCRPGPDDEGSPSPEYLGMQLVHLPVVHRRSVETLAHTALSVVSSQLRGADAAIVFNAANAPLLPVLKARGVPFATHVDGLEWRRGKWGPVGQRYYRWAESLAVRWSDALIADAQGIADYYTEEFAAPTELIAYGAPVLTDPRLDRLAELGLTSQGYHLVVSRFEPENHVLEICEGYARSSAELPLVVVGSAPYADEYTLLIRATTGNRIRLLGGVWDQELLDALYAGALSYSHGHSVGGTNPSLLRAAGAGAFTLAYDVIFNREVLGDDADFFRTPAEIARLFVATEADPERARQRGADLRRHITRYNWDDVGRQYEDLLQRLATRVLPVRRPSGRRHGRHPARLPVSV